MATRRNRETGTGKQRKTADTAARPPGAAASATPPSPLEAKLGYQFRQPALLDLAMTHRSHPYEARGNQEADTGKDQKNEPGTDNEQLEFVGDAVLGLVVAETLYRHFPQCNEGELTRLRASLVSRQRMAQMGAELGLDEFLKLGKSAEANGGRRKPALLANAAEAVLAAVYLDSSATPQGGLSAVRGIVDRLLVGPELPRLKSALAEDAGRGGMRDGKTLLQERVQAENSGKLRYVDIGESGPAHQRRFAVEVRLEADGGSLSLASAEGSSKKEAQQRAAALALAGLDRTLASGKKPDGVASQDDVASQEASLQPENSCVHSPDVTLNGASGVGVRVQEGAA